MRARVVALLTGILGLGCSMGPPIPATVLDSVAEDLCGLGHPHATFVSSSVSGWSKGSATAKTHDRYVDMDIVYQRKNEPNPNTMTVRVYLENLEPCRISLDVVADDGPHALMLDNGLSSAVVGEKICGALTPG